MNCPTVFQYILNRVEQRLKGVTRNSARAIGATFGGKNHFKRGPTISVGGRGFFKAIIIKYIYLVLPTQTKIFEANATKFLNRVKISTKL